MARNPQYFIWLKQRTQKLKSLLNLQILDSLRSCVASRQSFPSPGRNASLHHSLPAARISRDLQLGLSPRSSSQAFDSRPVTLREQQTLCVASLKMQRLQEHSQFVSSHSIQDNALPHPFASRPHSLHDDSTTSLIVTCLEKPVLLCATSCRCLHCRPSFGS